SAVVPPVDLHELVETQAASNAEFVTSAEQQAQLKAIVQRLLPQIDTAVQRSRSYDGSQVSHLDQEQEQEQEKVSEKEQEIEIEKYVDRGYSRTNEEPVPWPVEMLAEEPLSDEYFYPLSAFRLSRR